MRPVEIVRRLCQHAKPNYVAAFEAGDALFAQANITTKLRMCHFLARAFQETGDLTIEYESGNYRADRIMEIFGVGHHSANVTRAEAERLAGDGPALFERVYGLGNPQKAKELGNTRPGDGWRFRGTGILQMTGGYNFKSTGDKVGVDFYNHPELALSKEHALKPALHEWTHGKLNEYADADDALAVGRGINLGNPRSTRMPNGYDDQLAWLSLLKKNVDDVDLDGSGGTPLPVHDALWLQTSLNKIAYGPLDEDGRVGPQTRAAVKKFQAEHPPLVADGIPGPKTEAALESELRRKT